MRERRGHWKWFFLCLAVVISTECWESVHARMINEVSFSEEVSLGGKPCQLMGVGIRRKFFMDVYYGASYLHQPTRDPALVIQSDQPKRVVLHVVYKEVDADKWVEGWQEGFSKNTPNADAALQEKMKQFIAFFNEPVKKGEQVLVDYLPETGTAVSIKGRERGSIPGHDFMVALWSIWFGKFPPSESLKTEMLGK